MSASGRSAEAAVTSRRVPALTPLTKGRRDESMTTAHDGVQIVTITPGSAEVRLGAGRAMSRIGKIRSSNGRWFWEHRDGEKS